MKRFINQPSASAQRFTPQRFTPQRTLKRIGFTLIELLVVLGIIVILACLLMPAMRTSKTAARRMQCGNNLKQLILACHNYHDVYGHFPTSMVSGGIDGDRQLSGLVELLPFLDQNPMYESITDVLVIEDRIYPPWGPQFSDHEYPPWITQFHELQCPSAGKSQSEFGVTNYAFCVGDSARGLHDQATRGVFSANRPRTLREITDGTSQTIAISEIGGDRELICRFAIDGSARLLTNPSKVMELIDGDQYKDTIRLSPLPRGGCWADGRSGVGLVSTILPPGSPSVAVGGGIGSDGYFSASSEHNGGVQVALADCSVQFIDASIDCGDQTKPPLDPPGNEPDEPAFAPSPYGVWGSLGTTAGGEDVTIP